MPPWWGKSSSKEVKKKSNKESFIDTIHRKFKSASEEKCNSRSGVSRRHCSDTVSERDARSRVPSRSPSPSKHVSRCQSFAERPHAQPLPLPGVQLPSIVRTNSGINATSKKGFDRVSKPHTLPLPRPGCNPNKAEAADAEADIASGSVSSISTTDSDDPSDPRLLSPLASDYENGNKTTLSSPSRWVYYYVTKSKNVYTFCGLMMDIFATRWIILIYDLYPLPPQVLSLTTFYLSLLKQSAQGSFHCC